MTLLAHFPRRRFRGWLLRRAALFWLGGRLLLLAVTQGAPVLGPLASLLIVVAVTAVVMVEARSRGELLLLANAGVSPGPALALSVVPPLLGEAALVMAALALGVGE
jgi:hypothetical protein